LIFTLLPNAAGKPLETVYELVDPEINFTIEASPFD